MPYLAPTSRANASQSRPLPAGTVVVEGNDELAGLGDLEGGADEVFDVDRIGREAPALFQEGLVRGFQPPDLAVNGALAQTHLELLDEPRPEDDGTGGAQPEEPRRP